MFYHCFSNIDLKLEINIILISTIVFIDFIEFIDFIDSNPQRSGLSEQQLVDCAGDYNNDGCAGGLPSQAYEYLKYNHGMDTEDSYRYTAQDGPQCFATAGTVGATVAAVVNITSGDEAELVQAIDEIGPVSIAYQVSPDFRLYAHGVYDSYDVTTNTTLCNSTNMDVNHAYVNRVRAFVLFCDRSIDH